MLWGGDFPINVTKAPVNHKKPSNSTNNGTSLNGTKLNSTSTNKSSIADKISAAAHKFLWKWYCIKKFKYVYKNLMFHIVNIYN